VNTGRFGDCWRLSLESLFQDRTAAAKKSGYLAMLGVLRVEKRRMPIRIELINVRPVIQQVLGDRGINRQVIIFFFHGIVDESPLRR